MTMKGLVDRTRESIRYVPSDPSSEDSVKAEPKNEAPRPSLGEVLKQLRQRNSLNTPVGLTLGAANDAMPTVKVSEPVEEKPV